MELVRGNGWNVFFVIIVTVVAVIATSLIVGLVFQALDPEWVESLVVNIISNTIVAPFAAVAWTVMYFRLRALESSL
jgi:hypothetical protein